MLRLLLIGAAILSSQDPSLPPPSDPKTSADVAAGAAEASALAEYNGLRDKTPETAAAQWKLALWCEQKGLKPEAYVHFGRVIELDPKKDAAWLRLGFKRQDGRWMTPKQIAAEDEQKKAEKTWVAQLKRHHKEIHGGRKQAEARAALDAVTDPAAVSSVYREFGAGGPKDQEIAVQLLGQIDSPVASKVLAILAVYGKSPAVRRLATETLRGRKPEEFLDLLVGLMKDPLKYEVRPVAGPGSQGILLVEGERFNVRRFYAPPPPPNVQPRPGDAISYDANGMPTITHFTFLAKGPSTGVPGSKTLVTERDMEVAETFSYGQAMAEAQRGASVARSQLAGDVAQIEEINRERSRFRELVMNVAKDATGRNPGTTAKAWRDSLAPNEDRYVVRPRTRPIPTVDELVPLGVSFASAFSATMAIVTRTVVDS